VVNLLASYEETVGAITDVQWQRTRISEGGVFIQNDTGNLVICTRDAVMYDLFQTAYISFIRTTRKREEFCSSISGILIKKFSPQKVAEVFQSALTAQHILTIPMPIMLMQNDQIEIWRMMDGKPRGKRWNITKMHD
jgi:hypothetical protein